MKVSGCWIFCMDHVLRIAENQSRRPNGPLYEDEPEQVGTRVPAPSRPLSPTRSRRECVKRASTSPASNHYQACDRHQTHYARFRHQHQRKFTQTVGSDNVGPDFTLVRVLGCVQINPPRLRRRLEEDVIRRVSDLGRVGVLVVADRERSAGKRAAVEHAELKNVVLDELQAGGQGGVLVPDLFLPAHHQRVAGGDAIDGHLQRNGPVAGRVRAIEAHVEAIRFGAERHSHGGVGQGRPERQRGVKVNMARERVFLEPIGIVVRRARHIHGGVIAGAKGGVDRVRWDGRGRVGGIYLRGFLRDIPARARRLGLQRSRHGSAIVVAIERACPRVGRQIHSRERAFVVVGRRHDRDVAEEGEESLAQDGIGQGGRELEDLSAAIAGFEHIDHVAHAGGSAGAIAAVLRMALRHFVLHPADERLRVNIGPVERHGGIHVDAKTFVGWVQDKMPQGHTQYSSDGASATTCVRNMVYMLEPCYSGGQIFQLPTPLADPVLRKRFFPFLSDITVMTAADYNECSLSTVNLAANTWARSLYGYNNGGAVAGALQTKTPGSVWDVSKKAAQIDTSNPAATVPAYAINAAFGTGNNATMYVPGTSYNDPDGLKEHPLYRHVNFYPALTLRPSLPASTMGVPLGAEPNSLDMRLNGPNTPGNGPVPLQMSIYGVPTSDTLMVSREKKVWDQNPSLPAGLEFVEYYIFQLSMLNGSSFAGGSLTISYNQDTDPTQIADSPYDLFFEPSADAGWIDLHSTQDSNQREVRADIIGANGLGEFALVLVPEPGVVSLVAIACLIMIRRRRG